MKPAFFDIDTQIDFLFPSGALYVAGAERLLPILSRLNRHAAGHDIQVVSSTCLHAEDDAEFREWPPHCVVGTVGQLKPADTLLDKRVVVELAADDYIIEGAQQILFEKNQLDIASSPHFQSLLSRLKVDSYVVYGVVTEYCVRLAALALLATGKPVSLVTDAIQTLCETDSQRTLAEFQAHGGNLTTFAEVCKP